MGEAIENAEFLLRQQQLQHISINNNDHFDQHSIDFTTRDSTSTIADDLAFIMSNTALHETSRDIETRTIHIENSDSSDDDDGDSSDSSVVKVVELVRPPKKDTICISSSSSSSEDEEIDEQAKSSLKMSSTRKTKATEKSIEKICSNVLRRMAWKVDSIVRGEILSDSKFDSSEDDDGDDEGILNNEMDRYTFIDSL